MTILKKWLLEHPVRLLILTIWKVLLRLSVKEQGGSNRGEVVSRLLELQGGDPGDPWCAAAAAFAYELGHDMLGLPWTINPGLSTSDIVRKGDKKGLVTKNPKGGDFVCFKVRPGEPDSYGTGYKHTAVFNGWKDKKIGRYQTIEGNVGNAVTAKEHTLDEYVVFVSCI